MPVNSKSPAIAKSLLYEKNILDLPKYINRYWHFHDTDKDTDKAERDKAPHIAKDW